MYTMLREITVIGRGFYIAFSDIVGGAQWTGFLAGADRIIMDNHRSSKFSYVRYKPLTDRLFHDIR
jgi:hypothetical protein